MPPERATTWIPALVSAALVALCVGLAGLLFLESGLRRSTPALEDATRTGAGAVGQAVAAQLSRALQLGIPLDRLPGVESYLTNVAASSPQVQGLALLDAEGKTIAATADLAEGLEFPVSGNGVQANLVVAIESPLIDQAVRRLHLTIALTAMLSGIVAGSLTAGFLVFHRDPVQRRFLSDMNRVAAGDFTDSARSGMRGHLADAGRALALCVERARIARRGLVEAVATIRAVDFDGSLGRRVDALLTPVDSRYKFSDHADANDLSATAGQAGAVWRLALFLGLYGAALPYVANFAIDRESETIAAAWAPILPLLCELAAAWLGAWIGSMRIGRSGTWIACGCLLLAGSLAGTYWCRDYDVFVALRGLAGLSAGLVTAGLLAHRRLDLRRTDLVSLLIFSALLAAPLLAGLYAEAIGRRSGFLLLGIAVVAATPFVATGAGPTPAAAGAGASRDAGWTSSDMLLALAVVPASAILLFTLPASIGSGGYLAATGAAALLAVFALLAPRLSPLAGGAALLVAALVFAYRPPYPDLAPFVSCALLGLGTGGVMKAVVDTARHPWIAIAIGAGAGLVLAGTVPQLNLPFAAIMAAVALATAAIGLLGRPAIVASSV